MKENRKKKLAKELFKYGLAGVFNTMLGFIILYVQLEIFHVNKYLANIINYSIGFFTNFFINRYWTFKSKGSAKKEIQSSILVYIFSFGAQFIFVYFISKAKMSWMYFFSDLAYKLTPEFIINLIDKSRFLRLTDPDLILMCFGIVVFAGFNFSLNKIFTFRQKSPEAHILERAEDRMNSLDADFFEENQISKKK